MHIFIINLEHQTDKRQFMQAQLDHLGLEATFIPAVNGKAMSIEQLRAVTQDYEHSGLTPSEIGCALSHIKIYEKMVDEKIEQALILEDDAVLNHDLPRVLKALNRSKSPTAFLLTTPTVYNGSRPAPILDQYAAYNFIETWCTHGYVINQQAAKNLSEALFPVFLEADRWEYFQQAGYLHLYNILPVLIQDNDLDNQHSNISQERSIMATKRKAYYENVLKKNRPFKVRLKRTLWHIFQKPFIKKIRP